MRSTIETLPWQASRISASCAKGTEREDGSCLLRLDFPGYSGDDSLEAIEWDQWFRVFDKNELALIVEEKTAAGKPSNFNKLVKRENAHTSGR